MHGTNRTPLENLSTTVRIIVYPCDAGKSVTKSTAMWDQGLLDTIFGVLHWEQTEHEDTKE